MLVNNQMRRLQTLRAQWIHAKRASKPPSDCPLAVAKCCAETNAKLMNTCSFSVARKDNNPYIILIYSNYLSNELLFCFLLSLVSSVVSVRETTVTVFLSFYIQTKGLFAPVHNGRVGCAESATSKTKPKAHEGFVGLLCGRKNWMARQPFLSQDKHV